jgi:hypothetical protein
MLNSKLETVENLYSKSMETHNDFFLSIIRQVWYADNQMVKCK